MRIFLLFFLVTLVRCTSIPEREASQIIDAPSAIGSPENPRLRYEYELMQLVDPKSGKLPVKIHQKELKLAQDILNRQVQSGRKISNLDWRVVGPSNVGGRTRALGIDVRNEDIILAGGVSGGVWRTNNGGDSWMRTSDPMTVNSVSSLVQDTQLGQRDVWYYGTGEIIGNSARIGETPYRGDGIYKSEDNGLSWDVLASTAFGQFSVFDSPFNYVWNLQIREVESGPSELYAALYGCIVRSLDGGMTWETVLGEDLINSDMEDLNESRTSIYTNVLASSNGELFATLSTQVFGGDSLNNKGIFRSENGIDWEDITPTGYFVEFDRTVMSYAPSESGIVYFLTARNDVAQLWRYDNGQWSNRTSGLPIVGGINEGNLATLNTQGSYNMVIKVHPEDPDLVFVGGTNLYRSTNGFASISATAHVGGYDPEEETNPYAGHHPDQHEIVFFPSNPNQMLTGNDGGVRRTNNNRAGSVVWASINNGMITSQFYTIALSKESGSNDMLGGLQDNGTYIKPSSISPRWNRLIGGDGSYCAATPDRNFWYISFQRGQVFRVTLNDDYNLSSFAQIDPLGGSNYLFVNPFILDPNNYNRMYVAGGDFIWRNDNLSQATRGVQSPSSLNWSRVRDSAVDGDAISVMDISTNPSDILYYGTIRGAVYKLERADAPDTEQTLVLNFNGYISSISVDPLNADHVMITYGNYNISSIFLSDNGGDTWTDIGGNLEENSDGTGNGPSARWCEIIPLANGKYQYFLGTSIGLYSTENPDGGSTVWQQEGSQSIGNSVIRMMDYRSSDGRLVVATHGNGVFETDVSDHLEINPTSIADRFITHPSYPNPFDENVQISLSIPEDDQVQVYIVNAVGERVKLLLDAFQFAGDFTAEWDGTNAVGQEVPSGMYFYQVLYRGKIRGGRLMLVR